MMSAPDDILPPSIDWLTTCSLVLEIDDGGGGSNLSWVPKTISRFSFFFLLPVFHTVSGFFSNCAQLHSYCS